MKVFDLQRFLNDQKYTQKELAGLLSCSQPYLSAILSGKKQFSDEKLKLIKSYFGDISNYITEIENSLPPVVPPTTKDNQDNEVIINREIWNLLKSQSDAIVSQQRTIEKIVDDKTMQSETILSQQRIIEKVIEKKTVVQKEENAGCADVSASSLAI